MYFCLERSRRCSPDHKCVSLESESEWLIFIFHFLAFFGVYYFSSHILTFLGHFPTFLVIFCDFTLVHLSFLVDYYADNLLKTLKLPRIKISTYPILSHRLQSSLSCYSE